MNRAWPVPNWSWDPRFGCIISALSTEAAAGALSVLTPLVPEQWTSATLGRAPSDARSLADRYGGLRPGQQLLVRRGDAGLLAFSLCWPWGDGKTVSIRLALEAHNSPETAQAFEKIFSITR